MPSLIDRVIQSFGPEDREQYAFVQYLDVLVARYGIKYTSIPNSTYTKSPMQRTRNYLLGLRPGLCDLLVACPDHWLVFIEMKRTKTKTARGTVSPDQKDWIRVLSSIPNVEATVCNGAHEATNVLNGLLGIPLEQVNTKYHDAPIF